jgi:hypothetical protein
VPGFSADTQTQVARVRGSFLRAALTNPVEHAVAVVLGRLMLWGAVNAIPHRTMEGIFSQMALCGVDLGHKLHDKNASSTFAGIAADTCGLMTQVRFWDPPPVLPMPSAWRIVFDGITLRNGATVLAILVCFTSNTGRIVSELLDAPISHGSSGPDVAELVRATIDRVLQATKTLARYRGTAGLPCRPGGRASQPATRDQSSSPGGEARCTRAETLTCIVVDRAYSGLTGNKADLLLGEALGLGFRLGLADKVARMPCPKGQEPA